MHRQPHFGRGGVVQVGVDRLHLEEVVPPRQVVEADLADPRLPPLLLVALKPVRVNQPGGSSAEGEAHGGERGRNSQLCYRSVPSVGLHLHLRDGRRFAPTLVAADSPFGGDPDGSFPVLQQGAHRIVDQPLPATQALEDGAVVAEDAPVEGPQPQVVPAVDEQGGDVLALQSVFPG